MSIAVLNAASAAEPPALSIGTCPTPVKNNLETKPLIGEK
jgi:hypothetical protein